MIPTVDFISDNLMKALDRVEALYWSRYYTRRNPVKSYQAEFGGALAFAMPSIDMLALNRVIGLGNERNAYEYLPDIISFYHQHQVKRFFIQVSPYAKSSGLTAVLKRHGFRYHNNWTKMLRPSDLYMHESDSPFRLQRIDRKYEEVFGDVITRSFEWDDRMIDVIASSVGMPGYKHYMLYRDTDPVAGAALYTHHQFGAMAFAGTLPEYRGKGAQSHLLYARMAEAESAGCQFFLSETGEDTPEKPNISFRNMIKSGFELAYLRENWIYEFD